MNDPDRFFNFASPGSFEWWYFDAISDDGRDALVIVWYAGLPFDPAYGVATRRHLKDPATYPATHPLDYPAVGLSWYRDGRTVAYALNAFDRPDFEQAADPFRLAVAGNSLSRIDGRYQLTIETPDKERRGQITADLQFTPATTTRPIERDIGGPGSPHPWVLVAPDCRVSGRVRFGEASLNFAGRGYHDHNAGPDELGLGMRRWGWGRVHVDEWTHIYYEAVPRVGPERSVWVTCRDGAPIAVREAPERIRSGWRRSLFGIRHERRMILEDATTSVQRTHLHCVDAGPFYLRWLSEFEVAGRRAVGICELLETRNLHQPWFNWMIPYRLRRPTARGVAP